MTVKVVTDSTADLPVQLAEEMGITVVPAYVRFGDKLFRDGVDISAEEFYDRLVSSSTLPFSATPSARRICTDLQRNSS